MNATSPSPAITNLSEARRARMPQPEPVDIAAQWRAEIKARDWKRVHLAGDRSPPVSIGRRLWQYTFPTSRKGGHHAE